MLGSNLLTYVPVLIASVIIDLNDFIQCDNKMIASKWNKISYSFRSEDEIFKWIICFYERIYLILNDCLKIVLNSRNI